MSRSQLLTGRELAERLRVSPDTINLWARKGRIPVVRYSKRIQRFDYDAVATALGRLNGRNDDAR